jgi:hypothetical protein
LISKCVARLPRVLLLSEINPRADARTPRLDPVVQARDWHGLLTVAEAADLVAGADFAGRIAVLRERVAERGQTLVLRDWSHLDFIGRPYAEPTFRLGLAEALADAFDLVQLFTVRHPLDQWLSWKAYDGDAARAPIALADFMRGCRAFAEATAGQAVLRYEDFVAAPDAAMQRLCAVFDLPFDAGYADRWHTYGTVTGDVAGTRGEGTIAPLPRRAHAPALGAELAANADYRATLALLGYAD